MMSTRTGSRDNWKRVLEAKKIDRIEPTNRSSKDYRLISIDRGDWRLKQYTMLDLVLYDHIVEGACETQIIIEFN
jgi:hypothetical protein